MRSSHMKTNWAKSFKESWPHVMHPSLSSPPALSSINNFHTAPKDTNKFSGLHSLSFSTPELLVLNGRAPPRGPHVVAINPPLVRVGSRRTLRSQSHRQGFSKHGRAWMKGLRSVLGEFLGEILGDDSHRIGPVRSRQMEALLTQAKLWFCNFCCQNSLLFVFFILFY